jgi:hypothetical protein
MKKYLLLMLAIIGMAVSFTACSSDDDNDSTFTLNKQSVELIARTGVAQLEASISDVEWSSENPYVAVVSPAGRVTAIHVGETNIIARSGSGYKTCKVVVTPKYNTYVEPITEFGKSKDYIIKKLGVPSQETSNTLAYGESDDYQVTFYTFENDKLKTCGVSQLNCVSAPSPLGFNLGRRDAIFNRVLTTRSPRQRKVT